MTPRERETAATPPVVDRATDSVWRERYEQEREFVEDLLRRVERTETVLAFLQWLPGPEGYDHGGNGFCPLCSRNESAGHESECLFLTLPPLADRRTVAL